MPLVTHDLNVILFSLFFTVLIGSCLSKIMLVKCREVSKPRFISLFSVKNDQSSSHSSVLKPLR